GAGGAGAQDAGRSGLTAGRLLGTPIFLIDIPGSTPVPERTMPTVQRRVIMRPGVRLVVDLLGDKWTVPIIHLLSSGPRRYAELKRGLPGVSQRMLTRTLRRLEARGMLTRTVYHTVPLSVEYT